MRFPNVLFSLLWVVLLGSPALYAGTPLAQISPGTPVTATGPAVVPNDSNETTAIQSLVVEAPGDVEFDIRIIPTPATRELRVYADSGSFFRSSTISLDANDPQEVHVFSWRGFPAGDYVVVGMLLRDDGTHEVVAHAALKVVDRIGAR